eukprot:3563858-Pyramimonas_sp.AAC.1
MGATEARSTVSGAFPPSAPPLVVCESAASWMSLGVSLGASRGSLGGLPGASYMWARLGGSPWDLLADVRPRGERHAGIPERTRSTGLLAP